MPISVPGTWTAKIRGFTLLEVLVTLLLVGILTGLAVFAVGGNGATTRLQEEVQRLAALMDLHRTEGLLRGEQRGVLFTEGGYQFLSLLGDQQWGIPVTGNAGDRRELAEDISLELQVEGRRVDLQNPTTVPQVLLLSSGESSEFQVVFSTSELPGFWLSGDLLGRLQRGAVSP